MELWIVVCLVALVSVGGCLAGIYYVEYMRAKVNNHFLDIFFRVTAKMAREDYDNQDNKNKSWLKSLFLEKYGEDKTKSVDFIYDQLIDAYRNCYKTGFLYAIQGNPRPDSDPTVEIPVDKCADEFIYGLYIEVFYKGYDDSKVKMDLDGDAGIVVIRQE
ncbi:MAG: hypothetical protein HQ536_02475 [Parcubacteria group bacterium]|nr:hypothetical protein [Parcubacteria group bacterium]